MSEYTPTTEEIREYVMVGDPKPWEPITAESEALEANRAAAFDRWLSAHDEAHDERVRAAERERCAQIVDGYSPSIENVGWALVRNIAAAIRSTPAEQKESK